MTGLYRDVNDDRRRRRGAISVMLGGAIVLFGLAAGGWIGGLRINTTASEPLGVWRIVPLTRPVVRGDIVFVCPPDDATMHEALRRGYLRRGLCQGGFGPLIKTVIAVPGQQIDITDRVSVEGVPVRNSGIAQRDGKGRPLHRASPGRVPAGSVFLQSEFVGSWDSRYFGPIPVTGILGLAQEVLTYAP